MVTVVGVTVVGVERSLTGKASMFLNCLYRPTTVRPKGIYERPHKTPLIRYGHIIPTPTYVAEKSK
ncbi:hypothetical protein F2Q68_00014348 [Brassica cretica]|uniref:Uncharacterized protein n=1 Tax=Brassica cretica TaxID=69181 RepID=A0A8S9HLN0_BRACR|nr:hypothetical protein F2Q68_00014348 [Brassica cretica]